MCCEKALGSFLQSHRELSRESNVRKKLVKEWSSAKIFALPLHAVSGIPKTQAPVRRETKNIQARRLHLLKSHIVARGWKLGFLKVASNYLPLLLDIYGFQVLSRMEDAQVGPVSLRTKSSHSLVY